MLEMLGAWPMKKKTKKLVSHGITYSGWWWLEHDWIIFPYSGDVIIPTDELIFFRWVQTTNQDYSFGITWYWIWLNDSIFHWHRLTIQSGWWWLEHDYYFPWLLGMECHHPNWWSHIFQRGGNHQPDHMCIVSSTCSLILVKLMRPICALALEGFLHAGTFFF